MVSKTSVSNSSHYQDIGTFWDEHDATELGEQVEVDFTLDIKSQCRYFPVDNVLFKKIKQIAENHGISEETLLNLWIQEKVNQS
jgi:hypothetical protein